MLKPQELFIGAAIWLKSKNKPYEIDDGYDIYKLDEAGELMDADPIPITPEILTDWCGWEDINYSESITIVQKGDLIFKKMSNLGVSYLVFGGEKLGHIKYLHQLQALYQLLTGEVMPIKLPKNQ